MGRFERQELIQGAIAGFELVRKNEDERLAIRGLDRVSGKQRRTIEQLGRFVAVVPGLWPPNQAGSARDRPPVLPSSMGRRICSAAASVAGSLERLRITLACV